MGDQNSERVLNEHAYLRTLSVEAFEETDFEDWRAKFGSFIELLESSGDSVPMGEHGGDLSRAWRERDRVQGVLRNGSPDRQISVNDASSS